MREKVSNSPARWRPRAPYRSPGVLCRHGLQIDGENFLVPIDIDVKREADIPIQAVRLNDILNTLTSCRARCAS
jgi:hypothetical protein